eukprot:SAG22_NODE_177_length_16160_cov_41.299296_10_plen_62_part_00
MSKNPKAESFPAVCLPQVDYSVGGGPAGGGGGDGDGPSAAALPGFLQANRLWLGSPAFGRL